LGAYAEHLCLPEEAVAMKPVNATYEEAAGVVQGAFTALYFLRKTSLQPGQKILIYGASGGVGSYAVQLAKHHFKADVTGVCSIPKIEYVKSLGADKMIDYTEDDFTRNEQVYDVIFDTVGKTSISRSKRLLREDGYYLLATFGLLMLLQLLWLSRTSSPKFEFGTLEEKTEDLIFLKELVEAGVIKPVIDRCYPLEQAAEAHRYVEAGLKQGSVVLTVTAQ
jgi:NADPH:quinone reductase-like Zn-dependent oxidoreductase